MAHVPEEDFRSRLMAAGLLVATEVDGIYLRSGAFESVARAIDNLVSAAGAHENAEVLHLPAVMPRSVLEKSAYVRAFPDLVGSVSTFEGNDALHVEILRRLERGEDWAELLSRSDVVLCSAACHLVYPTCRGRLPEGGRRFEVFGQCFRHEPSLDPARMQAFRMHEFVYLGDAASAVAHRDVWLVRAAQILGALGLPVTAVLASDPFFGRAGKLLSANQRAEALKHEIVTSVQPGEGPVAVASSNCHLDHFGRGFGIDTAEGTVAHSACVGFGTERITLALLAAHGLDPARWPSSVRDQLWPSAG
ncbi:MAG TPA: amino acid--[acyl-carrier-protein] ligase [Acidimicrobiales bacterium]|nr:amino acid--[acyl-carrier-protein] ligase [Acidimicrobiales bacterium]